MKNYYKFIPILFFLIAINAQNLAAQDKTDGKLRKLQRQIEINQNNHDHLQDVSQIIDKEIENYSQKLIIKAEKIDLYEKHILKSTEQMQELQKEQENILKSLKDNKELLVETIIAMIRIGKNPPPAVLVNNDKIYNAIRAAKLLANVMPQITHEVKTLANEIKYVKTLRQQLKDKRENLAQQYLNLQNKYDDVNDIITKRQAARDKILKKINQQKNSIEKLDIKAKNLKELTRKIANLNKDKQIFFDKQQNTLNPFMPFEKTRGTLKLPVNGKIIKKFGENDINGEKSKGIYIKTPPFGQVISPIDGKIEFAGPLGEYGGVIIINAGQQYRIIIAGMKKIYLKNGYSILKGEPVGLMGSTILASLNVGNDQKLPELRKNKLKAVLYVEFRKNDKPTNSEPWWNKKFLNTG